MPAITLKNIPDELYDILKNSAKNHHRSINSEILFCLEQNLKPKIISPAERLEKIRSLRSGVGKKGLSPAEINKAIHSGRP